MKHDYSPTLRKKLKRGYYWAAVDIRGKQVAGGTIRRQVERAAQGLFELFNFPKSNRYDLHS